MAEILRKAKVVLVLGLPFFRSHGVEALEDFDIMSDFAIEHECEVVDSKPQRDGFVHFRRERVHCNRNLFPSNFVNANCGKRCRKPYSKKDMASKFRSDPITLVKTFRSRREGKLEREYVRLHSSCRCVEERKPRGRKSRRKNPHGRAKTQRGMSRRRPESKENI